MLRWRRGGWTSLGCRAFRFHPDYYPDDEVLDPVRNGAMFRAIEERGGIVKVHNRVGNVGQMARVVPIYPGITWIIDHMMYPEPWMAGDGWSAYLPVLELARFPNVVMTISDVHSRSAEAYPFGDMHSAVMMAIDAFGIEQLYLGDGLSGIPSGEEWLDFACRMSCGWSERGLIG